MALASAAAVSAISAALPLRSRRIDGAARFMPKPLFIERTPFFRPRRAPRSPLATKFWRFSPALASRVSHHRANSWKSIYIRRRRYEVERGVGGGAGE